MAVCYRQLHSVPSRTTPKLDGYFPSKGPPKILQSGPGRGRYKSKPTLAGSGVCDGHTEITSSHFNYREVKGDLFSCSATASLAHCVSEDFHMGKGIAALFKKQFGGVAKLREQGATTGGVALLERDGRFVYYLVTKPRYFHKPTYKSLRSSLERLRDHAIKNKVSELCLPKIGCGLDGLSWGKVQDMIREIFASMEIKITVYYL